uniref:Capsid protein n=1 Tax=Lygus hesperus TaxID=30085 RepID=A0A0A9WJS5_LYGHE
MRPKSAMESARSTWETRSAASDTPARSFGFGGSLSGLSGERCKICRKLGHRTSACWWKEPAPFKTGSLQGSKQQLNPAIRSNSYRRDHQGDLAKCYTCGDTSHFANKCPNRGPKAGASSFQPKEKASRYVNLCEKNPSGSLTHQGTDD